MFKNTYKIFFRKKSNILFSILLGLLISLNIFICTYNSTLSNFIKNDINKDFSSSTLIVGKIIDDDTKKISNKEIKKELYDIDGVIGVFSIISYNYTLSSDELAVNGLSGNVELYAATNETLPKIVKGTNFKDDNGNYIICPKNFYPNNRDFKKLTKNNFFNIEKYLNKDIEFKYENLNTGKKNNITYKLIGIYENISTAVDESLCFVNEKSLLNVSLNQFEGDKTIDINDQTGFFIQLKSNDIIEDVKKELKDKGYGAFDVTYIDYSIFNKNFSMTRNISIVLYIVIAILIIISLIKIGIDNMNYYQLLNYLGYKKINRYQCHLFNYLLFLFTSIIFSILFVIIFVFIIQILLYYKPLIFEKRKILFDYSILPIIYFIIALLTIIMSFITKSKVLNK